MKLLLLDQSTENEPISHWWTFAVGLPPKNVQTYDIRDLQTHDIVAVKLKNGYEIVKHRFEKQQKFSTKRAFLAHIAKYM